MISYFFFFANECRLIVVALTNVKKLYFITRAYGTFRRVLCDVKQYPHARRNERSDARVTFVVVDFLLLLFSKSTRT